MEFLLLLLPLGIFLFIYFGRGEGEFVQPEVSPISTSELNAFEAAPCLFVNAAEAALFTCLRDRLPREFHIHSKVRLEDIIRVKRGLPAKARWAARGRVKSRHVDYLITTRNGRPMLAIELDGSAHNFKKPSNADQVKTVLFQRANLRLQRIQVGENFHHIAASIAAELKAS